MMSLEEAQECLRRCLQLRPVERSPLGNAIGRILAEPVQAPADLPPFDNSAMDGYAVRSADVASAAAQAPVGLRILGAAPAGEMFPGRVESGTCVRVFTGSALPTGADAVVMQEDTRKDPTRPEQVLVLDAAKPWENVRFRGEDVKRGATILAAGQRLNALRVGLLAALGLGRVPVRQPPTLGLLATGSELLEPGQEWTAGKVFESNRLTLAPLLARIGAVPRIYPVVRDTLVDTRTALEQAFTECDAVVTTGGVSVGELDYVKAAFQELGGTTEFWQVAIRPGKPFVFGRLRDRFLFGLPGNPVSAVVTFHLLVRSAVLHWQGAGDEEAALPTCSGSLAEPLANPGDRRHFMRVIIDAAGAVRSTGGQASHLLASLAMANGLVDVPPRTTRPTGTVVQVLRMEG